MGLFDIFSSDPANKAARIAQRYASKGFDKAKGYIGQGKTEALGYLDQPLARYGELYSRALPGYDAHADAAGINGPEGYARAMASFRTNPGYEFTIDQALQAINRNAAATGRLASGNTDLDVANYVTGLADQQWGDYVARLVPYLNQPLQVANAEADIYGNKADIASGAASTLAKMATNKFNTIGQAKANAALADYNASASLWDMIGNAAKFAVSL